MKVAIYNIFDCTDFRCLVMKTEMLCFVRVVYVVPQKISIRSNNLAIAPFCVATALADIGVNIPV